MMILRYNISKPVNTIYDTLSNMDHFVHVHPVVYKADCIGENEFIFYEKIKILFLPFKFNYKVTVCAHPENRNVKMSSVVRKGVLLQLEFMLVPHKNYTEVIENVSIQANLFVRLIFETVITRVHKKLFFNIENTNK